MRNTKHQTPNTKEPSNTKRLVANASYPASNGENSWVLKDEPPESTSGRHPFDFEERTAVFGENI
jgi:hypothetical protein